MHSDYTNPGKSTDFPLTKMRKAQGCRRAELYSLHALAICAKPINPTRLKIPVNPEQLFSETIYGSGTALGRG
jgi:hypothetical protein